MFANCLMSWRRWAMVAIALCGSACAIAPAAPPPAAPPTLFHDSAFAEPAHRPDVQAVFAVSPEMRRYIDTELASLVRREGAQRALVTMLQTKAQLRLEYDAEFTRTAAEAFEVRAGNCLSLVVMTATLAKELSLPISYQALVGGETWSRMGGLSVINGHVNIAVGKRLIDRLPGTDAHTQIQFEFGRLPLGRGQALQVIEEHTLLAMFMNNRAAEHLVRGDAASAYAHAKQAIAHDPRYAAAYNTLGVIYQRQNLMAAAERAYQQALVHDGAHASALANLAHVYESQSRWADAAPLQARLAQLEKEPPFFHFDRGVAAARAGHYATARDALLREMRRDADYHEFHFWLAVALHGLGEHDSALKHLQAAQRNSVTREQQQLYAAKVKGLDARLSRVQ
jgi:tetratricopeptide (TPR) repeat protein